MRAYLDGSGKPVQIDDKIQRVGNNSAFRWIIAEWCESHGQWQSPLSASARKSTGCHTSFSKSLVVLSRDPNVHKYKSKSAAITSAAEACGCESKR